MIQCQSLDETREKIWHFTFKTAHVIDNNINPKKASGFDEICPCLLKELPKKAITLLTHNTMQY